MAPILPGTEFTLEMNETRRYARYNYILLSFRLKYIIILLYFVRCGRF